MKTNLRLTLLTVFALLSCVAFAQPNNLVVFSNDGYRFTLIVNGVRQNDKPETNVKVTGLTAPNYKLKVIFEDANYGQIDQNIYMQWGGEDLHGKELSCAIVSTKKGMKLRPESAGDITTAPVANQVVYQFDPNATQTTTYSQTTTTTTTSGAQQPDGGASVATTTTGDPNTGGTATTGMTVSDGSGQTTTTTTTTTATPNSANVGMNVGGVGMNISITDNTGGMQTSQTTTTTTTTTSSSSSSTTSGTVANTAPATTTSTVCSWPMSEADFAKAKASVEKQSFEDDKMKVAKQILNTNCMSTAQVKEIMDMFTFEDNKLAWAEYAYGKTTDPNNYYQLNDGFEFSSSVDKLNDYIESHKK